MNWKRIIGWAALAGGLMTIVAAIAGYFYLKSAPFQRFALAKIAAQVNQATGGKTAIGGLDFNLSRLTATLYDITLRSTEGADQPPLLHMDKLTVGIRVGSALHPQVSLNELLILHPVIHIQVSRDGKNNFPTPRPSQASGHTSVFDLAVAHAQITNGEVSYNDQQIPLEADLYEFRTDIQFTRVFKKYDGVISYKNGRLKYATYTPLAHDFDLHFSATPAQLTVESATLHVGSSSLMLQARVRDYSNPVADGSYRMLLHVQDFREISPATKAEGNVLLAGKLQYQAMENQPALRGISVDGHLASDALAAVTSGKRIELHGLAGDYRLADGNLSVSNLKLETFGGRITAGGEVKHLDSTPDSRLQASLQGISLRALQESFGPRQANGATFSGSLDGNAEATWRGELNSLNGRSDLTLRAQASSAETPAPSEVPINGTVHVTYDGTRQSVEVHNTSITIPSTTLTAQGTISDHSILQMQLVANDLHELEGLVSSFMTMQNPLPPISGKATLNAVVQGSLKTPTLNAQLHATNLEVQGSQWTTASLAVQANPSELRLENGQLTNARQGQASFSAAVQLNQWAYQPSGRIQAHFDAEQFRLADLLELANQQYPVSGIVTAKLSMDGSQLDPAGTGQIQIANAAAYGEPIQKITANIRAGNGSIVSELRVVSKAGNIDGDLSYAPKTKAYEVRVDAPSIVLQQLQTVQGKNLELTGTLAASVRGEGNLDDPQLTATIRLPELQVRGNSVSELKAEARIAQHRLDLDMDSKVSQVAVHAQGQVALSGDYEAQASVDTGTIPLETLLATYAAHIPGFQGQTELHATLHGPLKDKTRLQAHVSIPVLKASYQTLQVGITNPVQADYANSVVTLQPTDIEGTGTSLHVEGRIPIGGASAPTVTAKGTINLNILKVISPDVNSSGQLALDVRASGTASAPEVQGQLELKNVAVNTPDAPIGVDRLNGTLDISKDRLQVSKMTGTMGGGQVSIGGAITYRPSLQFNLVLQSQSMRLLYPEGLRTLLDANLTLNGNSTASTLNGRVSVNSLSFTPDFDLSTFADQFSMSGTISQPGFADTIKLAIVVQTPQTLSATSSQISISGQAALRVSGTAANPVITGRTTLTSGELFYRTVRYQLQQGVITFDKPNETHPVLNVSVRTTIEQYNLTLTMRGPLEKLTTSYVSDPPLATADIINLVARGKTTQESAANSQSTDSMLASQAASKLTSGVQKLAGLSSLQIDPTIGGSGQNPSARIALQQRVTKNLLFTFSTDVSQPGSEVIQGEYQINRRWSVSASRDEAGGVSVDARYHKKF